MIINQISQGHPSPGVRNISFTKPLVLFIYSLFFFAFVCYTKKHTDTPGGVSLQENQDTIHLASVSASIGVIIMDLPQRRPNRITAYNYSQNGTYFITICTHSRKKILSEICVGTPVPGCPNNPQIKLLPFGKIADKYIQQLNHFYEHISVDQYVIMPDHIHLLISLYYPNGHPRRGVPTPKTSEIARFIGTLKRFCNKEYGKNIWQSRFYDHVVRNQNDYNEIWEYIENNPQKWVMQNYETE